MGSVLGGSVLRGSVLGLRFMTSDGLIYFNENSYVTNVRVIITLPIQDD